MSANDTRTAGLRDVTGAAGDSDGFLLTAAAPDGAPAEVIGRITYDPPTPGVRGGLVLTLERFGDDGVFHPESAADVDEALALVDACLSAAMTANLAALVRGVEAARDDAMRAYDADADERARQAAATLAASDRRPTLEPANACWECGELIQRHDGTTCPNCGQEVPR